MNFLLNGARWGRLGPTPGCGAGYVCKTDFGWALLWDWKRESKRGWSCGRSPVLVCVVSGRLRALGLCWGSEDPGRGNLASGPCSRLVFCHGRCMCVPVDTTPPSSRASLLVPRSLRRSRPGSRAGLQSLLDMAAARCYIARVPPRLAVRCALVSEDGGVGRFSWLN